jgi:hypothetical protein
MITLRTGLASSLAVAIACSSAPAPVAGPKAATAPASAPSGTSAPHPAQAAGAAGGTCGKPGVKVSTAGQLSSALTAASPGETILLAPGTYSGHFRATVSGTASAPITLCGTRGAVIDGGGVKSGYTFYLDHSSWWRLEGFTVEGGQKGVVTDTSDHDVIDGLYVHGVGDEAIHLRSLSSWDTVSHNVIRDTGLDVSDYGEGIYVGSANHNWCRYSGCQPDASDHDVISDNNVADTTAENVDIKEGTSFGTITGNQFDGAEMNPSDATSWVNVKGNDWTIIDNTGTDSNKDGFSDHQVYPGWGTDNVFESNHAAVNGPGYGFYVQSKRLNDVVLCNNTVTAAQSGLSNHACTPAQSLAKNRIINKIGDGHGQGKQPSDHRHRNRVPRPHAGRVHG